MIRLRAASACLLALMFATPPLRGDDDREPEPAKPSPRRLVTLGAAVTEVAAALEPAGAIVGVDSTSVWPPSLAALPRVGYYGRVSAEGLLALAPDLVLADAAAGPETALAQVAAAGVRVERVPSATTLHAAEARILAIARALGREAAGERMVTAVREDLRRAAPRVAAVERLAPRVLFVYARGGGTVLAAGSDTAASAMIELAGGTPAVDGFAGYKPLSAEATVVAAPDVVLLGTSGLDALGGRDAVLELPGIALTPAGKRRAVVALDDSLLLGFGPRLGEGVTALADALVEAHDARDERAAAPKAEAGAR